MRPLRYIGEGNFMRRSLNYYRRVRVQDMSHNHNYIYSDIPGLGECKCGWYKVWNRFIQQYEEREGESK